MNASVLPLSHASSVRVSINELTSVNHPLEESFLVERFVVPGLAAKSFMFTGQSPSDPHLQVTSSLRNRFVCVTDNSGFFRKPLLEQKILVN